MTNIYYCDKATLAVNKNADSVTIEYADPAYSIESTGLTEADAARAMIAKLESVKDPHKYAAMRFMQQVML